MTTFEFAIGHAIPVCADFYRAEIGRKGKAVLYFHGGGLLYGTRDDLPALYLELFLGRGYDVVCFDYPLAPESGLEEIHGAVLDCLRWFLEQKEQKLQTGENGYYLFGRSAGAYLALYLAHNARKNGLLMPDGILSFYGYPGFDVPEFSRPSAYYKKLFSLEPSMVERLVKRGSGPVTYGPLEKRYLLYAYARQSGTWREMLDGGWGEHDGVPGSVSSGAGSIPGGAGMEFNLTPADLALLPPSFFTASSTDQDVPLGCSKRMARQVPGSVFYPVYNLEHDFDRDTGREEGKNAYNAALDWMAERSVMTLVRLHHKP